MRGLHGGGLIGLGLEVVDGVILGHTRTMLQGGVLCGANLK